MTRPRPSGRQALFSLLGLILAIGGVSGLLTLLPAKAVFVGGSAVFAAALDDGGSPSVGDPAASVTIVDFSDYQCAPCKAGEADFERVVATDRGVRVIYKDWAALGPWSKTEARIALAAAMQGRYLAVHQAFMRSRARPRSDDLEALAIGAGVDWPRLQTDLVRHGGAIDAQLSKHAFEAWSLGLAGPPGYLVGPFLVSGRLSQGDLRRLIGKAQARRRDA